MAQGQSVDAGAVRWLGQYVTQVMQTDGQAVWCAQIEYGTAVLDRNDGRIVAYTGRYQYGQAVGPIFANFDS